MRLLDRYILTEMIMPFVAGILAVLMMLVGNTLFALVDVILKNHIPLIVVTRLVVFNLPTVLVLTMPVGVALSGAMAVNRLARDNEVTVMRMAGVPLRRIFLPVFVVGLAASIVSFTIGEHVVPWSQQQFQKTQAAMFGYALTESPSLAANRVFHYDNYTFFVAAAARDPRDAQVFHLQQVLIIENPVGLAPFPRFYTAVSANYKNGLWTLYDVAMHSLDNQGFTSLETHAARMLFDLRAPLPTIGDDANGLGNQPDALTMAQLGDKISVMRKTGLDSREYEVAYYFKLSLPFLCFCFSLCAPPLSMRFSRTGSFVGVLLSIVMVFVAWNTVILAKAFGIHGYIAPVVSAWTADALFAALGLYLLWRME